MIGAMTADELSIREFLSVGSLKRERLTRSIFGRFVITK
jgi:hypothetical protein